MAATTVSLKLLIDSKGQRVLFAEAGKEFVDFLITILALPIGTVIRLLKKQGMVGCLQNFYESIESLSDTYLQPKQNKDSLLKPKVYISGGGVVPLQLPNIESSTSRKFYRCVQGHAYVSDDRTTSCPSCTRSSITMTSELIYVDSRSGNNSGSSSEGGYVKGVVTYMVMDDLVVKPMSTISSITLLNNFNVKDVGALEEKVVDLGMEEGLKLLKASLLTKNVLTDIFLKS
ncbi:uncharacterized protein LOC126696561 [Quercus robur]|uniref:uncharacterized protein LOC126696561 n=1 Tax=Quercus robur TaxID=38942 RepID=UPI0021628079|nr:uncharacterized protein LOC126696561 [Quercus robur]